MPWYQTRLTELLQISRPIIQAGMAGGITSPRLVAAVSNAGGLGSLGAGYMSPKTSAKPSGKSGSKPTVRLPST